MVYPIITFVIAALVAVIAFQTGATDTGMSDSAPAPKVEDTAPAEPESE